MSLSIYYWFSVIELKYVENETRRANDFRFNMKQWIRFECRHREWVSERQATNHLATTTTATTTAVHMHKQTLNMFWNMKTVFVAVENLFTKQLLTVGNFGVLRKWVKRFGFPSVTKIIRFVFLSEWLKNQVIPTESSDIR